LCGNQFIPKWFGHTKPVPVFCSRECASAGSVTELRRDTAKAIGISSGFGGITRAGMLAREQWKYVLVGNRLNELRVRHEFEYQLPDTERFFDLALVDSRVFVEFDGPYHANVSQREDDEEKDKIAAAAGWKVVRIQVKQASVIDADAVTNLCTD